MVGPQDGVASEADAVCDFPSPPGAEELETEGQTGSWLTAGACTATGRRPSNEDQHVLRCAFSAPSCGPAAGLFAVLDGHGGPAVAVLASRMLVKGLKQELDPLQACSPPWGSREGRRSAIERTFLNLDAQLGHKSVSSDSGTTCVAALVVQGFFDAEGSANDQFAQSPPDACSVILINLGDSRGLVVRGDVGVGTEVQDEDILCETEDHKPNNPTERKRICEADGVVTGGLGMFPARVDGDLALSRAFGDFRLKDNSELPPEKQKVSSLPDVYEVACRHGDIVVLACDGAFDVLSSREVAAVARRGFAGAGGALGGRPALEKAAAAVVAEALRRGTMDNVTCVVVRISNPGDGADEFSSGAAGGAAHSPDVAESEA